MKSIIAFFKAVGGLMLVSALGRWDQDKDLSQFKISKAYLTIGLDAMLQAVKLPASVTDLDTGLSNVDGNNFTHVEVVESHKKK